MLATMVIYIQIFLKDPFFYGQDNYDQLVKIAKIMGTNELIQYLDKYNLQLDPNYDGLIGRYNKAPWRKFIKTEN